MTSLPEEIANDEMAGNAEVAAIVHFGDEPARRQRSKGIGQWEPGTSGWRGRIQTSGMTAPKGPPTSTLWSSIGGFRGPGWVRARSHAPFETLCRRRKSEGSFERLLTSHEDRDYPMCVMDITQPIQPVEQPMHSLDALVAPGDFAVSYYYWFTAPPAALAGRLECQEH